MWVSLCYDVIKSKGPELAVFLPRPVGLRARPAVPSPGVNPAHLSPMELEAGTESGTASAFLPQSGLIIAPPCRILVRIK